MRAFVRSPRRSRRCTRALGLTLGLAVVGFVPSAHAGGLNIERMRLDPDEDGVSGGFDVSFGLAQGNVNLLDLGASGNVAFRRDRHLVFVLGDSRLAARTRRIDGGTFAGLADAENRFFNKHQGHLRYNYRILDWLRAEAFTQAETNEFLIVEARGLLGGGPRLTPFANEEFGVHWGAAYMAEYEQFDKTRLVEPGPEQSITVVHRLSTYLTLAFSRERVSMQSTTYVQPRFDLWRDLRILNENEIEVKITEVLGLKLMTSLRYDSIPPVVCGSPLSAGMPCADDEVRELRSVDIAVKNAIAVSF